MKMSAQNVDSDCINTPWCTVAKTPNLSLVNLLPSVNKIVINNCYKNVLILFVTTSNFD